MLEEDLSRAEGNSETAERYFKVPSYVLYAKKYQPLDVVLFYFRIKTLQFLFSGFCFSFCFSCV